MPKRGQLDNLKPFEMGNKAAEKPFDKEKFETLCKVQCTEQEILDVLGYHSHDTLNSKLKVIYGGTFEEVYPRFKSHGKESLRRAQWKSALNGNTGMLIWLGKQELGQKDKQETTIDTPQSLQFVLVGNNANENTESDNSNANV